MRSLPVILAICSLPLGGCGTFSDAMCGPTDGHVYYRGVRLDVEAVREGGPMVLMAGDIPFSAVADTQLVPYLACQELTDPPPKSPRAATEEQTQANRHKTNPLSQVSPKE
jgi:uncharacterized protein YceK